MKKVTYVICFCILAILSCNKNQGFISKQQYGSIQHASSHLKDIWVDNNKRNTIIYDKKNRIAEVRTYYQSGNKTDFVSETYQYNSHNQIILRKTSQGIIDHYVYENGLLTKAYSENINSPEWKPSLEYEYKDNKIVKAKKFFGKVESSYILFEYDKKGNTTSRKEYLLGVDKPIAEIICTYDINPNPFQDLGNYPIDMIQKNNIASSYIYAIEMSSLATTYDTEYEYNEKHLPVSSITFSRRFEDDRAIKRTYVYK